ncbi:MAG: AzlC family ABC transporter permease [Coriobacteriia bacterium]|nr:AzlC family ABC transporter permease [Coriobacteriia bacterium]
MSRTVHSMLVGARDVAAIVPGIIPFGLVAGAAVASAGFGLAEALGMSLLVNAGASQLAATSLFAEGASLVVVIGTALIVNARMFIYSTSLAPTISPLAGRLRPFLGHALIDQSYAATMTIGRNREDVDLVHYYIGSWLCLASVWQVTNVLGVLAGSFIPAEWALDFAVPLVFLAMLVPTLRHRVDIETSLVAAFAAAVLVPLLPLQTGLPAAILLGMAWGAAREEQTADREVAE